MSPTVKAEQKSMGRPLALTPETQAIIVDALRDGVTRDSAAYLAKISYDTFKRWMREGRKGIEPFFTFCTVVLQAEAEAERDCAKTVMRAARSGEVGAAVAFLSRRRKKWSDKARVDHKGSFKLDVETLSDKQLEARIARLEAQDARGILPPAEGEIATGRGKASNG